MRKIKSILVIFLLIHLVLMPAYIFGGDNFTLVIHGGSGNIPRETITEQEMIEYESVLALALKHGEQMLKSGADALDVVVEVVKILEDSSLFNAGKGSVFNIDGRNELDASIMCGKTGNAGAVAGVTTIKNPIEAARKVMEKSPHVMMIGKGAELFAFEQGVTIVDPSYFFDQKRWNQYREVLRKSQGSIDNEDQNEKMGTVGAVALDKNGNMAAATSTGGMVAKKYGRVGDSPIIGAGTYAENGVCAVSATGHGEFFIRNVVAYDIAAQVKYAGKTIEEAAGNIIKGKLADLKANGGVIVLDKDGNVAMVFNTTAMFRGYINHKGESQVKIFED
ncbi:MAG: isoaspartyl peptidase/L-asparaginase [Bacteroidetes bacterium]|nr:isoaspartyl peptidase/L-asparaginase [Bacteroidota bacterium]